MIHRTKATRRRSEVILENPADSVTKSFSDVQERLFSTTLRFALVVSIFGDIISLYVQLEAGWRIGMLMGYLLPLIFLSIILLRGTLSTTICAWAFQLSLTAFLAGSILSLGYLSAYHGLAIFLSCTALIFLNFRAAVIQAFLCIGLYILMLNQIDLGFFPTVVAYEDMLVNTTHKLFYGGVFIIMSALTLALLYNYVNALRDLAEDNSKLAEYNKAMIEGFADAPAMFALWDQEDRLLFCTKVMKEKMNNHGIPYDFGITYGEVMRLAIENGVYNLGERTDEEFYRSMMSSFRKGKAERANAVANDESKENIYALANDEWRISSDAVTSNGMVASFRTDITEIKSAERRMQFIVDSISDRILTLNEQGRVTFANLGVSESFGFTNEQLLTMHFGELIPDFNDDHLGRLLSRRSGDQLGREIKINNASALAKDGSSFNVGFRCGMAKLKQEPVITVVMQDYSLLDSKEARVRAMFDAIQQIELGMLLVDRAGEIYFANEQAGKQFSPNFIDVGKSFKATFSSLKALGHLKVVDDKLAALCTDNWSIVDDARTEISVVTAGERYIQLVGHPLANGAQMWIFFDNTDDQVKDMQLQQATKLASLGEMAAGIAHEINQPLNVIRLATVNIEKRLRDNEFDDPNVFKRLDRVNSQIDRATFIIDQLREFSREAKEVSVVSNPVRSAEKVVDLLDEQLRLDGINLLVDFDVDSVEVLIHPTKLEQVLVALVNNARDKCVDNIENLEGRGTISIGITSTEDSTLGECVAIEVSDNGGGIPSEVLDRVFDPFFTTKAIGSGTGLGLSVSYRIIKESGGILSCRNIEAGASFRILLPKL